MIVVAEFDHRDNTVLRYELKLLPVGWPVDDHNPPSVWVMAAHRTVVAWQRNVTNLLYLRVGTADGSPASLTSATTVTIDIGGTSSYTDIHRITHLSDASQDTFWIFTRKANHTRGYVRVSVNQATGAVTAGSFVALMQNTGATGQLYAATADAYASGNQVIRFAAIRHPDNGDILHRQ